MDSRIKFFEEKLYPRKEIGGGMNFKRQKFLKLMSRIQQGEIAKLLIAHKDRLCRFGFDYFLFLAKENGCEIIVVNQESLSPQQEVVSRFKFFFKKLEPRKDLMAIIHTFSCRLYGLRKYKKNIKKVITNESDSDSKK